jgi:hypothetical protein
MGTMTLLQLFIWAVILVSIGQVYLLARYLLWPRIRRITHCPWCWKDAGIARDFPAPWSSTICSYHLALEKARRLARQRPSVAATKPTVVVLQTEEVQV